MWPYAQWPLLMSRILSSALVFDMLFMLISLPSFRQLIPRYALMTLSSPDSGFAVDADYRLAFAQLDVGLILTGHEAAFPAAALCTNTAPFTLASTLTTSLGARGSASTILGCDLTMPCSISVADISGLLLTFFVKTHPRSYLLVFLLSTNTGEWPSGTPIQRPTAVASSGFVSRCGCDAL